jgi:hypothetical protein
MVGSGLATRYYIVANTLAYYSIELITAVKGFMIQGPAVASAGNVK